jgi:hypothetical protein
MTYSIAENYSFIKILAPPEGKELTENWTIEVSSSNLKQAGVY